jgi:hypothetical protein
MFPNQKQQPGKKVPPSVAAKLKGKKPAPASGQPRKPFQKKGAVPPMPQIPRGTIGAAMQAPQFRPPMQGPGGF